MVSTFYKIICIHIGIIDYYYNESIDALILQFCYYFITINYNLLLSSVNIYSTRN